MVKCGYAPGEVVRYAYAQAARGVPYCTTQEVRYARELNHRPGSYPQAAQRLIHNGPAKRFGAPEGSGHHT